MWLTHKTLSNPDFSTWSRKRLMGVWIFHYPGPPGLCPVVASFRLLSLSLPPMTMLSAWTWPGVKGQRGNQMWLEVGTLGAVRHERSAHSPAKTCIYSKTMPGFIILKFFSVTLRTKDVELIQLFQFTILIKGVISSWSSASPGDTGSISLLPRLLLP